MMERSQVVLEGQNRLGEAPGAVVYLGAWVNEAATFHLSGGCWSLMGAVRTS